MHTDAKTLPSGTVIEGDLCIVGAGAAGISIALQWLNSSRNVILLEGGGFDQEPEMQELYRGDIVGRPYYPLDAARLHYFGGTSGHWAGYCATFDPIDFEKRSWVPHSGWPIRREDLDPFYARANKILDLGPYEYDANYWAKRDPDLALLPLDPDVVWTKMWQFSIPPTRFGTKYRDAIVNARNVHLYTHANVCEVEANEGLSAVDSLRVRTLDGKEYRVKARSYVLACCSIQNARLLLASNRRANTGLGNANDLVGRFFMEHFEMPCGELVLRKPQATKMKMYLLDYGTTKVRGELSLSPRVQKEYGILNGTGSIDAGWFGQQAKSTFQFIPPSMLKAITEWDRGGRVGPIPLAAEFAAAPPPAARPIFHLHTRQEQAPNPSSRVTLSSEKDAMGMPRANLDWQFTDLDKRSMRTYYKIFGQEMGRTEVGRVQLQDWLLSDDRTWPSFLSGGWHHMGTTRMADDPKQGVVDANCRVHGLGNLYVAGASAFTTAGPVNPTLSVVALSLRLSDHLQTKVG